MATKQPNQPKEKQQSGSQQKQKQNAATIPFLFDRSNYMIMIAGVVVILLGFVLMSGGGTDNPNIFPKEELYSFRRIALAPIIIMIGFGIEVFAILKRPKS